MTPTAAERSRKRHAEAVGRASDASRQADLVADDLRDAFYRTLHDAHGKRTDGKLTYDEIAAASGWTYGWVRLALNKYRQRQRTNTK